MIMLPDASRIRKSLLSNKQGRVRRPALPPAKKKAVGFLLTEE
jgi:hypothetical protein